MSRVDSDPPVVGPIEADMRQYCDTLQMEPDHGLRALFVGQGRSMDHINTSIAEVQQSIGRLAAAAGESAGLATTQVLRAKHGMTLASIGRTRLVFSFVALALAAIAGWELRGLAPVRTPMGHAPPGLAEAMAATDLGAAWQNRIPQREIQGRTWSLVPFFDQAGAPQSRQ